MKKNQISLERKTPVGIGRFRSNHGRQIRNKKCQTVVGRLVVRRSVVFSDGFAVGGEAGQVWAVVDGRVAVAEVVLAASRHLDPRVVIPEVSKQFH